MNTLSVLHIVPWFPDSERTIEGIFILEHIRSLNQHCKNKVLHISFGKTNSTRQENFENIAVDRITIKPIIDKWVIKEKRTKRVIQNYLDNVKDQFDIVNFYITYPNAIYINNFRERYPNLKFCLTEHWSAYHTSFNLEKGHKGRNRIESIFKNNIPLLTVSNALGNDIRNFIGNDSRPYKVVPNCIDKTVFNYKKKAASRTFTFTSVNTWSKMKNPFVLIEAFKLLSTKYDNVRMILAGNGILVPEMESLIQVNDLDSKISLPGRVPKDKIPELLAESDVYCQSSYYETFSVICVEALALGRPVVASNIGGMKDFINNNNGLLVDELEKEQWFDALEKIYLNYNTYDQEKISENCLELYDQNRVGKLFYDELMLIYNGKV